MEQISLIIPAHNEEKRIGRMLESYGSFFEEKKKRKEISNFEILVVINGTTDRTEDVVKSFVKKYHEIRYLNFPKLAAKGLAIIEGFKDELKRKNEFIGFVDADMSTSPNAFYELVRNIKNYDGVIANRWVKGSIMTPKQSLIRRIISRGGNFIVRTLFLFPYSDTQCGAKLFKRKLLEKNINKLITINWGFDIALLYCFKKEDHARIKSIPTVWHDKAGSKLDIKKTPLRTLMSIIRLRLIHSPFRFIVRFYRKIKILYLTYKKLL